jgi:hypothetical protein
VGSANDTRQWESHVFRLFKSEPFQDEDLGEFHRSDGLWKGSIILAPCGTFRLSLAGSRQAPDPFALNLAKELPDRVQALLLAIENWLFQHYTPYREAVQSGQWPGSSFPEIASAEAVWPHLAPAHVLIEPRQGAYWVEIAFKTDWDIEHTVAAIFRNWELVELNGSVHGQ